MIFVYANILKEERGKKRINEEEAGGETRTGLKAEKRKECLNDMRREIVKVNL
jgi:hypothetical protein